MKKMLHIVVGISFLVVTSLAAGTACEDPKPLRFSLVPRTDMAKLLQEYQPLMALMESELGRKVTLVQPSSYGMVIEGLVAGSIDIASMGPASYAIAKNREASILPFVTWTMQGGTFVKPGAHTYQSLLIVRQSDGFGELAALKGRTVSLTDPASSSGSVIPREAFRVLLGMRLEDYFGRVVYSGSHDRSIDAVKRGDSDAAFVASEHLDEVIRQGRVDAKALRVLWQSNPIPHDPFVFRGKLCAPLREKIRRIFLADSPAIKRILANLKAERFVPVSDQDYKEIQEILIRESR